MSLRIALVIERMDVARGGRERSVAEIAAGLAGRGHDVTVLCRQARGELPGVRIMPLPLGRPWVLWRAARFVCAVHDHIRREHYDIIHATLPVPGAHIYQPRGGTVSGMLDARRRRLGAWGRLRNAISVRTNPQRLVALEFEKAIAADLRTACVCVSKMVAEEFARHYKRTQNVHVVYNGVHVPTVDARTRRQWRAQRRQQWGVPDHSVVFLCVAQNFRLKGVREAIEAFAEFEIESRQEDSRLVIVGGDEPGPYRRLAERRRVGGRVIFLPPEADVWPLYSAADAVVLLSWQDACSRVVLEAMRWGVPSLTTRYNAAHELLDSAAGRVVDSPADTAAVVVAMRELADPSARSAMAAACLAKSQYVSLDRQVDELAEVYKKIVQR